MVSIKQKARIKRKKRIRKKVFGTEKIPRLGVYKSLKHIYAFLVDDVGGKVITTISTLSNDIRKAGNKKKDELSFLVGKVLAKKAKEKGITKVVFDTSGYKYHGNVKRVAEGARSEGLKF